MLVKKIWLLILFTMLLKNIRLPRIISLLLTIVSINCQHQGASSRYVSLPDLKQFLHEKGMIEANTKHIFILPKEGCLQCISRAQEYVVDNYDTKPDMKFIFTRINSLKILKRELDGKIYRHDAVVIDSLNELDQNGFFSIYPIEISISNKTSSITKVWNGG